MYTMIRMSSERERQLAIAKQRIEARRALQKSDVGEEVADSANLKLLQSIYESKIKGKSDNST